MATALDRIKALQAERQQQRDKSSEGWVKWKEGDKKTIRIVPDPDPDQFPFREYALHYGLPIPKHCLASQWKGCQDECPLCAIASDWRNGSHQEQIDAKNMNRKPRAVYRVIDRKDPERKVQKMSHTMNSYGTGLHDEILAFISSPDYGDITDVNTGRDLEIYRPPNGAYTIKASPRQTPLAPKQSEIAAIMEAAKSCDLDAEAIIPEDHETQLLELAAKILDGTVKIVGMKDKGQPQQSSGQGRQEHSSEDEAAEFSQPPQDQSQQQAPAAPRTPPAAGSASAEAKARLDALRAKRTR